MKKKPKPAAKPVTGTGGGGPGPPPARKPPPKPAGRGGGGAAPAPRPKPVTGAGGGGVAPAPAKKPAAKKPPVKRKLALGEAVACCAAEALAASLRLAGGSVQDEDVLALYWHTASDADAGATILETLEAASASGLGRARLVGYEPAVMTGRAGVLSSPLAARGGTLEGHGEITVPALTADQHVEGLGHPLILGLDLPGGKPHAVYDDGTAWWSWGEPWDPADFPDARIEEAWQVTW